MNYVKKFLTMSFLSALATFSLSCLNMTKAEGEDTVSYSDSSGSDEVEQKNATVTNKVIKYKNGDSWNDIFNRAEVSTHDESGYKLPGCTGYWIVKSSDGKMLYNERNNYSAVPISSYWGGSDTEVIFSYLEGTDDLYTSEEPIVVKIKNSTHNYVISNKYDLCYTISGNEKVAKDIDPNDLVSKLGIQTFEDWQNKEPVDGVWSWENPEAPIDAYISTVNLVFKPSDNDYHNMLLSVKMVKPGKEEKHSAVKENDVTQNVSSDGVTSAVKKTNGITWVKEESDGSSAWYGFEDPNGVLPEGTRVSVKWDSLDRDQYWDIFNMFSNDGMLPEKVWRFDLQALAPNNELIHYFNNPLNVYIEIGEDWDKNEIVGLYAKLEDKIKENWDIRYEDIMIDGKKRTFAVLSPTHFSEYYLADNTSGKDIYDKFVNDLTAKVSSWSKDNPNASEEEKSAQKAKIAKEMFESLSDDENKALLKYIYDKFVDNVTEKFNNWLKDNPNASKTEQNKQQMKIGEELYQSLPEIEQKALEAYLEANNKIDQSSDQSENKTEEKTNSTKTTTNTVAKENKTSTASEGSASTKTGVEDYSQLLSILLIGSFAGMGSCLRRKKD